MEVNNVNANHAVNKDSNMDQLAKHDMKVRDVVMFVFCLVAAGAFGIEEAIPSSGPGITLVLLIAFPIVWALPLCLELAELGSLMPCEGGIYNWVKETMGEFWGWQAGFWSGLTTWLSQAEYCALAVGYLEKFVDMSPVTAFALKVLMVIIFTVINLRGLEEVSVLETIFTIAVIVAFAAVTVVGLLNWEYSPVHPFYNHDSGLGHSIGDSIAIMLWMFCGYECISNMAQEVKDPQVIPKGLIAAQPVIGLSYLLPTLAGLVAVGCWEDWSTESTSDTVGYMDVLTQGIGPWAGAAFVVVAIISNMAIFNSYIVSGSRVFFVLGDEHLFPGVLAKVSKKRGVPHVAIIVMALMTVVCCLFDFKTLVLATTPLQMFLYMLMAIAIYRLRKQYPVEWRKKKGLYVIPFGKAGLWICMIPTFFIAYICCYLNGAPYFIAVFLMVVISLVIYIVCKLRYKGEYKIDPEVYPLNPKTKLGMGDTTNIGLFVLLVGLMAVIGAGVMQLYEGEYGLEYYLEEFESGLFANFPLMISLCLWVGVALSIIGGIVFYLGKKTETSVVRELEAKKKVIRDQMLCQLHGWDSLDVDNTEKKDGIGLSAANDTSPEG